MDPGGIQTHASHILGKKPNHQTTDTTSPLVPVSKGLCKVRSEDLDLVV